MMLHLFLAAAAEVAPPATVAASLWERAASPEPVEVLVLLRQGTGVTAASAIGWRDVELLEALPELSVAHLRLPGYRLHDLAWDPQVVAVSPVVPVRALRAEGRSLIRAGTVHNLRVTGQGVGIAVLDTGVDDSHPELAPGGTGSAVKTVRLYDAIDGDGNPQDGEGHGTAVAGIAAGKSGGVAPGAWIVAVRVLNNRGEGTSAQIAAGLDALLTSVRRGNPYNVRVVNLSLGGYSDEWRPGEGICDAQDPVMAQVFRRLEGEGVLTVAAAGNGGCTRGVAWPACLSPVMAVGAVYDDELCFDPLPLPFGCLVTTATFGEGQCMKTGCSQSTRRDRITCYSDSGEKLSVWAPSHCARTTKRGGGYEDCFGGTSAAAPYVAGAAALLAQAYPHLLPQGLRWALERTGTPRTDDRNQVTRNRIDVAAAYTWAGQNCPPMAAPRGVGVSPPSLCGEKTGVLTWVGGSNAARFRVQVASSPDFADAEEVVVSGPPVEVRPRLTVRGRLYLRVREEGSCAASPWATTSVEYLPSCERAPRRRLSPPR